MGVSLTDRVCQTLDSIVPGTGRKLRADLTNEGSWSHARSISEVKGLNRVLRGKLVELTRSTANERDCLTEPTSDACWFKYFKSDVAEAVAKEVYGQESKES